MQGDSASLGRNCRIHSSYLKIKIRTLQLDVEKPRWQASKKSLSGLRIITLRCGVMAMKMHNNLTDTLRNLRAHHVHCKGLNISRCNNYHLGRGTQLHL